ncbi:Protein of uncharacterised function (DUF2877) [Listeria grayi]|uniref:DUF2877 domain-containing protein n=1 Tax=Listeria grayi TaxID=1641 RepID=UPI0004B5BAEB|nr:DUF2877 domain-containing protein [Listeria grayi]VEI31825.1 Protein of uncharacterised function (DUF2877) [Listeria grayi]
MNSSVGTISLTSEGTACSSYALRRLEEGRAGYVRSIFQTSLNIEAEGFLFHIGEETAGLSCNGCTLTRAGIRTLLATASIDDLVLFRSGLLRIFTRGGVIHLDLSKLKQCSLKLPSGKAADQLGNLPLLTLPSHEKLARSLTKLATPLVERDHRSLQLDMLGLGEGLTPSGDDMLVGYTAVLQIANASLLPLWLKALRSLPLEKTTSVAASYIEAVCEGQVSEALFDSLTAEGEKMQQEAFQKLLQLGHTSGNDTLLGMQAALIYLKITNHTKHIGGAL